MHWAVNGYFRQAISERDPAATGTDFEPRAFARLPAAETAVAAVTAVTAATEASDWPVDARLAVPSQSAAVAAGAPTAVAAAVAVEVSEPGSGSQVVKT